MNRQIVIATVAASIVAGACLCAMSAYAAALPLQARMVRAA